MKTFPRSAACLVAALTVPAVPAQAAGPDEAAQHRSVDSLGQLNHAIRTRLEATERQGG